MMEKSGQCQVTLLCHCIIIASHEPLRSKVSNKEFVKSDTMVSFNKIPRKFLKTLPLSVQWERDLGQVGKLFESVRRNSADVGSLTGPLNMLFDF